MPREPDREALGVRLFSLCPSWPGPDLPWVSFWPSRTHPPSLIPRHEAKLPAQRLPVLTQRELCPQATRPGRAQRPTRQRLQAPPPPCFFVCLPCLHPFLGPGLMDTGESPGPGHTQWSPVCGRGLGDRTESCGEAGACGNNSDIPS